MKTYKTFEFQFSRHNGTGYTPYIESQLNRKQVQYIHTQKYIHIYIYMKASEKAGFMTDYSFNLLQTQ